MELRHADDEVVIIPTDGEELIAFPSEEPDAQRSSGLTVGISAARSTFRFPSLPRLRSLRIDARMMRTPGIALAALALLLFAMWPHERSLPTTERERPWMALAQPLDPQLLTPNPAATRAIQHTLNVYRDALSILDADAVKGVWPAVDVLALRDRLIAVREQNLDYYFCNIDVASISATALCRGTLSMVGSARPRRRSAQTREWHFKLRKQPAGWTITQVAVGERGGAANAAFY